MLRPRALENIAEMRDKLVVKHEINKLKSIISRSNQFSIYTAMNVAIIAKEMEANGQTFSGSDFSSEKALLQINKFMDFNENLLDDTEAQQREIKDLLEEIKRLLGDVN
ncbi:hypothetical protein [Gluconobacter oxydans]|uniref:hypothetical protein n=1 Tax=Gluconobacter oxydans TaxID=442 RepID=UPI0012DA8741|nr:hypothetical protein [Gluconobacter oxydans]